MPVTLTAVQCPALQRPSTYLSIPGAVAAFNAPVSENDATSTFYRNVIQPYGSRLDILSAFGGGNAWCILSDSNAGGELAISIVSGLNILVNKGQANIFGICYLDVDTTFGIPPTGDGRYWIWLKQAATGAGALQAVKTSLTPPGVPSVLLGSVLVTAGVAASVDTSGVLYRRGGMLWRQTADAGVPGDTPPASVCFLTVTAGGTFLFDGAVYNNLPTPAVIASFLKAANNLSDVASAATSRTNLGLAIGTNVEAWSAVLDALASVMSATATATAQRTALGLGTAAVLASDPDGTLAANSDLRVPTQKAVKTALAGIGGSYFDAGNSGAAITLNFATAHSQKVTLNANTTFTLSNPVTGTTYALQLLQDGTGGRTITWPAAVHFGTGATLITTAGQTAIVTLFYDGAIYWGAPVVNGAA